MQWLERAHADLMRQVDDQLQRLIDYMVAETGCTPEDAAATLAHIYANGNTDPYAIVTRHEPGKITLTARVPIVPSTPPPPEAV